MGIWETLRSTHIRIPERRHKAESTPLPYKGYSNPNHYNLTSTNPNPT